MRTILYFLINSGFLCCLIFGIYYDIEPARNVAVFFVVVAFVAPISSAIFSKEELLKQLKARPLPVPVWLDMLFDITCVLIMVSNAWFTLGSFYFVHMFLIKELREQAKKIDTPADSN